MKHNLPPPPPPPPPPPHPVLVYLIIYVKIFQIPAIFHFLGSPPPPICNWGGSSNDVFAPLKKTEYLGFEGFFGTEFDRTVNPNTNI